MEKAIRGRPYGTKNKMTNTKYIVKFFDIDKRDWFEYKCSSYEHIKNILQENHNYPATVFVVQNIALGRKKDKLLSIVKFNDWYDILASKI